MVCCVPSKTQTLLWLTVLEHLFACCPCCFPLRTAADYLPKVSSSGYTNKASTATWLAGALPSSATVVKAFNNLSAYTLLHGDPLTEHMKSVAASDDWEAAETAASFGRAMGLEVGGAR